MYLEDVSYSDLDQQKEAEADAFAREWICPETEYQHFVAQHDFSEQAIRRFAHNVNTHPALIEGRLCKEDKLHWSMRKFRIGLRVTEEEEE